MHSAPTSRVGTPAYLAPEVINNRPGRPYDARKADLWSAAILLYCMVANRYPFRRATDDRLPYAEAMQAQFRRILLAEYDFPPNKPFRCVLPCAAESWLGTVVLSNSAA
jgi:serine/threonine-protein kinase SRK2